MKKILVSFILITFLVSFIVYPQLPQFIPMHWNIRGNVDSYWPKSIGAWFNPVLMLGMLILFQVLPQFDPKREKYKLFKREWEIMQTGMIGFFAYLHLVILYISMHPDVQLLPFMFTGLGSLFILMGNYMSKIRQNYFIGIKIPWTLANEDNWNKTHRFASWCFVIVGIVTIIEAFVIWYAPIVVFGGILLTVILPMIYSFLLYKKAVHKMKYIFLGLFIIIVCVFLLRVISGEDDWNCQNGTWVMHGKPSSPQPTGVCM
jgi:uncharacterized membrane protein